MRLLRKFADILSCSDAARKLPILATSRNIRTRFQSAIRPDVRAPASEYPAPFRAVNGAVERLGLGLEIFALAQVG